MAVCPDIDSELTDPGQFFDGHSIVWKRHYIGWGLCALFALIATVLSFRLLYKHAKNYTKPAEQRQIMRILLMIPIYAIISALSYRFYKEAIYYETIRDCYEAFVIHSFFMLLLTYLGDDNETRRAKITGPERQKLMFPLNCFYYNPSSDMFLHYMKYGILQYVVVKPITTIAAVVLQYKDIYCTTSYSFAFGRVYITIINFASVTVAMYCLVLLYMNIKTEIADRKPFLKFLCVKLVIFFVFWQYCLLSLLGTLHVFKETEYWSVENIELGISALLVCFEMVIFAILHMYSFSYVEYVVEGVSTPVRKSLRDGFNPVDLFREVGWAFQDIYLLIRGRPLPTREGHLSGTLKRANTRRQKNRLFFKSRKGSSPDSVDPSMMAVDESTLEAGGKFLPATPQDTAVQAPLLSHVDGRNPYPFASPGMGHESYEMSATGRRSDNNNYGQNPNSSLSHPQPP
ncbi:organic solute transporter Ostalpha-domain-containing protein, partial [Linnemannia elongata]